MTNYESIIEQIFEQTGVAFRHASEFDLARLEGLGLPTSVVEFYAEFEPSEFVDGRVRLFRIEDILEQNEKAVPSCYSSPHGYIAFASTNYGDAYCFDVNRGRESDPGIVLLSHEVVDENTSAADFARLAKPVARNLLDFLEQFVRGTIDQKCKYD